MTPRKGPVTIVAQGAVDEQASDLIGNTPIPADTMIHHTHELRLPLDAVRAQVEDTGPRTLAQNLYDATSKLLEAQREVAKLQALYAPGTSQYAQCETIDDRLHDALALLGQ